MATGVSTISSMNSLFSDIYDDTLFVASESTLMAALVTPYSASGMASRYVGIYPQATASVVPEGEAYSTPVNWTKTTQMTITPFKIKTQVILTDERVETDPEDARRAASIELGNAIAKKIDQDLLALFSSFDTDLGAAGSAMTIGRVAAAIAILRNNAMIGTGIYCVQHPYHWFDIWNALGQPTANQAFLGDLANQALRDFYVGNWINASWFLSSNIAVDTSDDGVSGVFSREALALDTRKPLTMEPDRDADRDAWKLNMSAWYGKAVRRSGYGVAITADATEPTGV